MVSVRFDLTFCSRSNEFLFVSVRCIADKPTVVFYPENAKHAALILAAIRSIRPGYVPSKIWAAFDSDWQYIYYLPNDDGKVTITYHSVVAGLLEQMGPLSRKAGKTSIHTARELAHKMGIQRTRWTLARQVMEIRTMMAMAAAVAPAPVPTASASAVATPSAASAVAFAAAPTASTSAAALTAAASAPPASATTNAASAAPAADPTASASAAPPTASAPPPDPSAAVALHK